MSARRGARGFSTLEVVVAAAIFAAVMIPLLTLEIRLTDSYQRYERAAARATLIRNATAVLRDVNPMQISDGRIGVGDGLFLEWKSRPLTPEKLTAGYPVGDGEHVVALFALEARIVRAGARGEIAAFTVERMGWRPAGASDRQTGVDAAFPGGVPEDQIP